MWQSKQGRLLRMMPLPRCQRLFIVNRKGVDEMVKFWSERIAYDLNRIDEVPAKLREKVKKYIEQHMEA